jgi:type I restriction enzyme M protein
MAASIPYSPAMGISEELAEFRRVAAGAGMVLATTPARVCGATGATFLTNAQLARVDGTPNEQFYKWELVSALVRSGVVPADNIGCELEIPRGSHGSTSLFIDVALFRDPSWVRIYNDLKANRPGVTWDDLTTLLVGCGEIKADPRDDMEHTLRVQVMPALAAVTGPYAIGFYYNAGHLVICARSTDASGVSTLRLDPAKQAPGGSVAAQLNPSIPDSYALFPTLGMILARGAGIGAASRAHRALIALDVMSSRNQRPVEVALDRINRVLDSTGLRAETGYRIVIETLAAKVHDEKQFSTDLQFYIDAAEVVGAGATITGRTRVFRDRIQALHAAAQPSYPSILHNSAVNWGRPDHVRLIAEVVAGFQDISFVRSSSSDLYQVVFYNFAGPLSKINQAQFMTPLRVIEFMVSIANPKADESLLDPTMGIGDFLAVTFFRQREAGIDIHDRDLYGVDNDGNMLMLAALNMLLNGDGLAHLYHVGDSGSLDHKLALEAATASVVARRLDPIGNARGHWELEAGSGYQLREFDIVLTNPPFGDGRALKIDNPQNREIVSMYDTYSAIGGPQIDKGILFLENAVQVLQPNGRFGIILSNALMSVREYERARQWLLTRVRVVAVFDLPKDIFAETGVPTCILVGYKPNPDRLLELQGAPYEVFSRTITRVGFTKVTRSRNTLLVDKFLVDPATGRVRHDPVTGEPLVDEEFSDIVRVFRDWARTQEPELQDRFL